MLRSAVRERAIVLYSVSRVDPLLLCDGSPLGSKRSLQGCYKLSVIEPKQAQKVVGGREQHARAVGIPQAIMVVESGSNSLGEIIIQWPRWNRGFALARQVGPLSPADRGWSSGCCANSPQPCG